MENKTIDHNSSFAKKINEMCDDNIKRQQAEKENIIKEANKYEESDTIGFGDLLLDGILKSATEIVDNDIYKNKINEIVKSNVFSPKQISYLYAIINMMVTQITYTSLLLYDDLLKSEIQKQLDHVSKHMNLAKSDIEALKAVVQIHSKDLSSIKKSSDINKFKKENGIWD